MVLGERDVRTETVTLADEETQTEPVGAVAKWRRLVTFERRLAFLLRVRQSLTEYLVTRNGLYQRPNAENSTAP